MILNYRWEAFNALKNVQYLCSLNEYYSWNLEPYFMNELMKNNCGSRLVINEKFISDILAMKQIDESVIWQSCR